MHVYVCPYEVDYPIEQWCMTSRVQSNNGQG